MPLLRQAAARMVMCYRIGESYEVLRRRNDALNYLGKAMLRGYSMVHQGRS
jgi:hypothetical protein